MKRSFYAGSGGIWVYYNLNFSENIITGNGNRSNCIGIQVVGTDVAIADNTLQDLEIGAEIAIKTYEGLRVEKNVFTDNLTGIKFLNHLPNATGSVNPPVIACNTFSGANLPASKGIYMEPGVTMINPGLINGSVKNRLGGDGAISGGPMPNGNLFIQVAEPVHNAGSHMLDYWVYDPSFQDLNFSSPGLTGVAIQTSQIPGNNSVCIVGSNTPGVTSRMSNPNATTQNGTVAGELELLGQNYPNPTQGLTVIPYNLPEGCRKATLEVRNILTGLVVKTFELSLAQAGGLTADLNSLSNGLYAYTLILDGKYAATKMLVLEK